MSRLKLDALVRAKRIVELQKEILKSKVKIQKLHFVHTRSYQMRSAAESELADLHNEYRELTFIPEPQPPVKKSDESFPGLVFDPQTGVVTR